MRGVELQDMTPADLATVMDTAARSCGHRPRWRAQDLCQQIADALRSSSGEHLRSLMIGSRSQPTNLYLQSDGRDMTVWHGGKPLLTEHVANPVLWAHLEATLPTRDEPQPEPLDPGVRVRDRDGRLWAKVGEEWVGEFGYSRASWQELHDDIGPLTIVTPAPEPTPDERPCMSRGPRIGEEVVVCKREELHSGQHRTDVNDGHGIVRWANDYPNADAPC